MELAPDVALAVIDPLRTALSLRSETCTQNVTLGRGVSLNPRKPRMVMVDVVMGRRLDVARQAALLRFNVWAETYAVALDLAILVNGLAYALPDGKPIKSVKGTTGPVEIADAQPRLYSTFDLIVGLHTSEENS